MYVHDSVENALFKGIKSSQFDDIIEDCIEEIEDSIEFGNLSERIGTFLEDYVND